MDHKGCLFTPELLKGQNKYKAQALLKNKYYSFTVIALRWEEENNKFT